MASDPKLDGRVPTTGHIPTDAEINEIDAWFDRTIMPLKRRDDLLPEMYPVLEALDTAVSVLISQMRDCRDRVDVVGMAVAWGDLTRTARGLQSMPGFQAAWLQRVDGTL